LYSCKAYCRNIHSDIELPDFVETSFSPWDIDLRISKKIVAHPIRFESDDISPQIVGGCIHCTFPNEVRYEICSGNQITLFTAGKIHPDFERLPLSGFAMAAVLHQCGLWVLHGSAVEINGKAVVVAGEKMAGKSTLVAGLLSKGHRLISDDVTALAIDDNGVYVLPGIPAIKLWPKAAESIGLNIIELKKVYPGTEKRNYYVGNGFYDKPARLETVFLLQYGDTLEVNEIKAGQKIISLSCCHYFARFSNIFSSTEKELMFKQCSLLAEKSTFFRFIRPPELRFLDQETDLVAMIASGGEAEL
jgi:HPr Serine kinase C-terminal domain